MPPAMEHIHSTQAFPSAAVVLAKHGEVNIFQALAGGIAFHQFPHRRGVHDLPRPQQDDLAGYALHVGHHMGRQQNDAVLRHARKQSAQADPLPGVKARGGLVQNQQARVPQQSCRQKQALLHAAGVGSQALVQFPGEIHRFGHSCDLIRHLAAGDLFEGRHIGQEPPSRIAVVQATKLKEITFDEMLELASLGAQVLNNRSVELAKKYGVELEVISSLNPVPGTIVKEETKVEGMLIKGVAKDENVAVISIMEVPDVPGMSFKVFSMLAQRNINVDIILQSSGRENNKDLIFTVPLTEAQTAVSVLNENKNRFGGGEVQVSTDYAKVSIVGAGMQSHSGVASTMFEALFNQGINIHMISTSEIKISVIIDKADADRAVTAIHDAFIH